VHVADRIDVTGTQSPVARWYSASEPIMLRLASSCDQGTASAEFLVKDRRMVDCQNVTISMKAMKRVAGDSARRESSV